MKFGTGVERGANTKIRRVKVQNDIHTSIHISKLVVCLSTNGERALKTTLLLNLILTTNTQAIKIKSLNYV